MAYREPGVYTTVTNTKPNVGYTPNLVPIIIGEGPAYVNFPDKPIVRSSAGLTDTLPSTTVTAITEIYTLSGGVKTVIAATGNYALTAPNVVTWVTDGPAKPANGVTYYASYEARPETIQYSAKFISTYDELDTYYGGMLMKVTSGGPVTSINPIYLGAFIALEAGAPGIYAIQVEPAAKTGGSAYGVVMSTDIVSALAKAALLDDGYFVVPLTSDSTAVGATITHCDTYSTTLERKERVCFVNKGITAPTDTSSGIFSAAELATAKGLVNTIVNKRVRVPFITKATKVLSDGVLHELGAEYVCAALAGLASIISPSRALTRQKLYNFVELKNVPYVTRGWKNELAEAGFMILDQPGGAGSAVVIRHGNTTKMNSVEDKEHSIVTVCDYTSKYLRSSLEGYIGVYNVDDTLLSMVKGTFTSCKDTLMRDPRGAIVNDLVLKDLKQDVNNPDTLLITASLNPPYPCNYIDIAIVIE